MKKKNNKTKSIIPPNPKYEKPSLSPLMLGSPGRKFGANVVLDQDELSEYMCTQDFEHIIPTNKAWYSA